MIKIVGPRRSGKTTKLIELASKEGFILVEPTAFMADSVKWDAKANGYEIEVISAHEFLTEVESRRGAKYLVDELDMFLTRLKIYGYSNEE